MNDDSLLELSRVGKLQADVTSQEPSLKMEDQRKPKGLPCLSRNLLVIIADYLPFLQVLFLAMSQ